MKINKLILSLLAIVVVLLSSCNNATTYDHYVHTPLQGWEKNDTLNFKVPPVSESGLYALQLGLRIIPTYPFMGITLLVQHSDYQENNITIDTLNCKLVNTNGQTLGKGVSYYQYNYQVTDVKLNAGDSILVRVRHDMKREILPGISDVGIILKKIN